MDAPDVLVVGGGSSGAAAARAALAAGASVLVVDRRRVPPGIAGRAPCFALDLARSDAGDRVAGLSAFDVGAESTFIIAAKAVVLATGSADALVAADSQGTGDAIAMAWRADVPVEGLAIETEPRPRIVGGVATDEEGATTLAGLFAAGRAASGVVPPERTGRAAAAFAARVDFAPSAPMKPYSTVDSPMPPGFAAVKLDRLRETLTAFVGKQATPDQTRILVDRLKGEADDYARARLDPDLKAFQNACHAARALLGPAGPRHLIR